MTYSQRNIIVLQWIVIGVLFLGGGTALFLASHKADEYRTDRDDMASNTASYKEQLRQLRSPSPTPAPALPEATANQVATPAPTPAPAKASKATPAK